MKLLTEEARKCGYRVEITVCLSHFNELKRLPKRLVFILAKAVKIVVKVPLFLVPRGFSVSFIFSTTNVLEQGFVVNI